MQHTLEQIHRQLTPTYHKLLCVVIQAIQANPVSNSATWEPYQFMFHKDLESATRIDNVFADAEKRWNYTATSSNQATKQMLAEQWDRVVVSIFSL